MTELTASAVAELTRQRDKAIVAAFNLQCWIRGGDKNAAAMMLAGKVGMDAAEVRRIVGFDGTGEPRP